MTSQEALDEAISALTTRVRWYESRPRADQRKTKRRRAGERRAREALAILVEVRRNNAIRTSADWQAEAKQILTTIECEVCRGFGAEVDGTYPCTKCGGSGRVKKPHARRRR